MNHAGLKSNPDEVKNKCRLSCQVVMGVPLQRRALLELWVGLLQRRIRAGSQLRRNHVRIPALGHELRYQAFSLLGLAKQLDLFLFLIVTSARRSEPTVAQVRSHSLSRLRSLPELCSDYGCSYIELVSQRRWVSELAKGFSRHTP